ncbi:MULTISPECIES: sporulation inhibitor of replication protein SirA [Salipaludibacillus]|nr:sporulation inhibitor of replication protein SirA [Salipaludibacillus neizhouensis]
MRRYDIILVNEEVAYMYNGMEKKLFHLFVENYYAKGILKTITDLQINYIKNDYHIDELDTFLFEALGKEDDYHYSFEKHILQLDKYKSYARLILSKNKIILYADGSLDAETMFFEVLRNFRPYFLAISVQSKRYGWLKPIRPLDMAIEY